LTAIVACAPQAPKSADAATYQHLITDLSGAVTAYRASASAMQIPADCSALLQQYMARALPDVDGMRPIAGRMDGEMAAAGWTMDSDLACGMNVIAAELARHAGMACASADVAGESAEAARHCDVMDSYLNHMEMRSAELSQVMGGMMTAGTMTAVDGGLRMADGGWMSWGHEMPGCTLADGGYWMMDAGTGPMVNPRASARLSFQVHWSRVPASEICQGAEKPGSLRSTRSNVATWSQPAARACSRIR